MQLPKISNLIYWFISNKSKPPFSLEKSGKYNKSDQNQLLRQNFEVVQRRLDAIYILVYLAATYYTHWRDEERWSYSWQIR